MRTTPDYRSDPRTVLTLDAGGTHLVFSAICGNQPVMSPITLPSEPDDLDRCLHRIVEGFGKMVSRLSAPPHAISFAFPGPADYPNGIIEDPPNFPCFRGGVALGPFLEKQFNLPVFINNDGDLFTYGESIAGLLPQMNQNLKLHKNSKQYKNLLGVTFGTGFGCGLVADYKLHTGDNSAAGEIWVMRNRFHQESFAEESVSIRGIRRHYAEFTGRDPEDSPEPKTISEIARGECPGDQEAAVRAFETFGRAAGDALANAVSLIDGLIVVGGGLSGAGALFLPAMIAEMNRPMISFSGTPVNRTELTIFNLEDDAQKFQFLQGAPREILIPGTREMVTWNTMKCSGVGLTVLGTSLAVSIGAYVFALTCLDRHHC